MSESLKVFNVYTTHQRSAHNSDDKSGAQGIQHDGKGGRNSVKEIGTDILFAASFCTQLQRAQKGRREWSSKGGVPQRLASLSGRVRSWQISRNIIVTNDASLGEVVFFPVIPVYISRGLSREMFPVITHLGHVSIKDAEPRSVMKERGKESWGKMRTIK